MDPPTDGLGIGAKDVLGRFSGRILTYLFALASRVIARTESEQGASSVKLLERVLNQRSNLNLAGNVFVDPKAVKSDSGGYADVFEGYLRIPQSGEMRRVAVKRLRMKVADEKLAKVCLKFAVERSWADQLIIRRTSQRRLEYGPSSSTRTFCRFADISWRDPSLPLYPTGWAMDHFMLTGRNLAEKIRYSWYERAFTVDVTTTV